MLALKIILLSVGVGFVLFGWFILFRKKYSLINGFEADCKAGRKNEAYARRVGKTELILGVVFLFAFLALCIFA